MKMFIVGSATGELVGLCITFLALLDDIEHYSFAVVYCDSQHVIDYVGGIQPKDLNGWNCYPLILLCRSLYHELRNVRSVKVEKVSSALNRAHTLAHQTLQEYKAANWEIPHGITLNSRLLQAIQEVDVYTRLLERGALTRHQVWRECSARMP